MNAIPWYQSPVLIGLIVSAMNWLFSLVKISVSGAAVEHGVEAVLSLIGLLITAWSLKHRIKSTLQPIALTQGHADVKNSTITPPVPPAGKP